MPKIMNEWETIDYLIEHRCGIARYGDGELKLCLGSSTKSHNYSPEISTRLRGILRSDRKECLVGIPRVDRVIPTERKKHHWAKYDTDRFNSLYLPGKVYGSAFITRFDEIPEIDCEAYWQKVRSLWQGRSVVVLQGTRKPFLKNPWIVDGATSVRVFHGPVNSAFTEYDSLMATMLAETTLNDLIILALGAAATVIAYDLSLTGRQALDLGHLGMFYARAHYSQTGEKKEKDGF